MFEEIFNALFTMMMAKFMLNDIPHAAGLFNNPSYENIPAPTISEVQGNITVSIQGVRAVAELSVLGPSGVSLYGLDPDNWIWFNRLINQSGIPRVGTLLLDAVLSYCEEESYSILNQVNAYGDISQKELEDWYARKGFTPVDYEKYGNALLKWAPKHQAEKTNPAKKKTIAEYEKEITVTYLQGNNEKAHQLEEELYRAYPKWAKGDIPDKDSYEEDK